MEWLTSRASVETGMCSRGWGVLCPVFTSPTPLWSQEGLGITITELGGIPLTYSVVPWPSPLPCELSPSVCVFVLVSISSLVPAISGGTVVCSLCMCVPGGMQGAGCVQGSVLVCVCVWGGTS